MRHASRLRLLLLIAALVAAGCSVTTPRSGTTVAAGSEFAPGESTDSSTSGTADGSSVSAATPSERGGTSGGRSNREGPATGTNDGGSVTGPQQSSDSGPATDDAPSTGSADPWAVGVTDDTLTVSFIGGFGDPVYGPLIEELYNGVETWIAETNANGGIHGREIIAKKVGNDLTPEGSIAACKEVQNNGSFTSVTLDAIEPQFVTDCLDKAGFLNFYWGAPEAVRAEWTNSYSQIVDQDRVARSLPSFIENVMNDGDKRLGAIYLNQTLYKEMHKKYVDAAADIGLEVVHSEPVEPNQQSFTSEILRLQEKGVENLAIFVTVEVHGILRDAKALNFQPSITGTGWIFDFNTQAVRDLAEGAMAPRQSVAVNSEAFEEYKRKAAKYGHASAADGEALQFYGKADLLGAALDAAGRELNRGTLRAGIESIDGYFNGILGPTTWGPGDYIGTEFSFPAVCCNSDWTWKGIGPPAVKY